MDDHVSVGRDASFTAPYWDDLAEGQAFWSPGITVTEAHLVNWAGLTGDLVSLHLDAEYAASTQFGARIAHGPLTLSLSLGLMTQTRIFENIVAWLGLDEVRALAPVYIGDTIHAEATVVATRAKHDDRGIWSFHYRTVNQHGDEVMTFRTSLMARRRPG